MKHAIAFLLALMLLLSLAACGGGNEPSGDGDKPSGGIAEIDDGGAQGSQTPVTSNAPTSPLGVETKDDRIVSTVDDGLGNIAVTEYIYKDGAVSEITLTMQCADTAAAKTLYDTYTTGSMKEYGEQLFSDIKLDGKNVSHIYNEAYVSTFSGMSMEQLAASLDLGGNPLGEQAPSLDLSGNSLGEQSPSLAGSPDVDETAYNYAWSDLSLPDGFPQLDSGVTDFNGFEGGCMLTWNTMAISKLEDMITKIEAWSGLPLEVTMEMETAKAWSADSDTMAITVNYYADTMDAQVMIAVQTF